MVIHRGSYSGSKLKIRWLFVLLMHCVEENCPTQNMHLLLMKVLRKSRPEM